MPCLALGKGLFPAIKTWKRITTKLLKKLHPCKFIKTSPANATRYKLKAPPFSMYHPSLPSKKNRRYKTTDRRQLFGALKALHRPKHQYRFKKQSSVQAPPLVFIDELFWAHPNEGAVSGGPKSKVETVARSDVVESSNGLLRGIDARAEEFINRFRAELEKQEIVEDHVL